MADGMMVTNGLPWQKIVIVEERLPLAKLSTVFSVSKIIVEYQMNQMHWDTDCSHCAVAGFVVQGNHALSLSLWNYCFYIILKKIEVASWYLHHILGQYSYMNIFP
jgi:hypothetical protein